LDCQEARRSGDQKRVAEVLERRVAERTSKLTAVNEELGAARHIWMKHKINHYRSFGWRVSNGEIIWSDETLFESSIRPNDDTDRSNLSSNGFIRTTAALVRETIERASQGWKGF